MVVAFNSLAFAIFHILFFRIPINFQVCEMSKCVDINVRQSIVLDMSNDFHANFSTCLHSRELRTTPGLFKRVAPRCIFYR